MGITINANPSNRIATLSARTHINKPIVLVGKTFSEKVGKAFGSYKHALEQAGLQENSRAADIHFEGEKREGITKVTMIVGKNRLIISNLLSESPNKVANTLVQKAFALGKISLPADIQGFIKPIDMVDGDLSARIMSRPIHISPEGEIWTPPQIGGRDTWHKVEPENTFNLILPDWLHGGLESVSMNNTIEGGVLEGITWKKQKIRIRPNGNIIIIEDKKETTMEKDEQIDLVIPDCLIGKIAFNGKTNRLPLYGYIGDKQQENKSEYISIREKGEVQKMAKGAQWEVCSAEEIERLGKYPTQYQIHDAQMQERKKSSKRLVDALSGGSQNN